MPENFDLIVLGGGRAANLAIAAAKDGKRVALVEQDRLGGACPNRGCVPSKLLVGFAAAARQVRSADRHFIRSEFLGADLESIFGSVNDYVGGVDGRYAQRAEAAGVTLVREAGHFCAFKTLQAGARELRAETIVVATGARPAPSGYEKLPTWTSDDLFPMTDKPPASLLVIGGGFVGCEMAAFFAGVGTRVSLFTTGDRLLGREDADIERVFQAEFSRAVDTHCGTRLKGLAYDGKQFEAVFELQGQERRCLAERVLFAIGRVPNTGDLQLANTGLAVDERGFLPVNECLETRVPGIYAAGDVNGRYMLQHAASYEVHYLRHRLLKGETDPIDERLVAHAVFSHPEVASIGYTEEQLKAEGIPYAAVFEDWLASARAMAMRIQYPRIKLLVAPENFAILGCHLVGPESATLLHQVLTVMRLKNDVRELANMIYIHPALNECLLAAAVKVVGKIEAGRF